MYNDRVARRLIFVTASYVLSLPNKIEYRHDISQDTTIPFGVPLYLEGLVRVCPSTLVVPHLAFVAKFD